jgi:hypothetical protein
MPQRTIETPEGLGNIYRNDQKIADVRYALQVNQEYSIARTLGRSSPSEVPGVKNITGKIEVLKGERNLMGETLTLHLEDGHELKFVASQGNIMAGTYTVRGSGPIV